MEVMIRDMEEKDLSRVLEMENLCFTTPWSFASFSFEIKSNPMSKYFVATMEDEIVGYGGIWYMLDEAHVTTICVDPKYRGNRIGNKLFEKLETMAIHRGMRAITLEVRKTNIVAKNLYRSFGLSEIGVRPNYYQDNNEDAIIMIKEFKDVL